MKVTIEPPKADTEQFYNQPLWLKCENGENFLFYVGIIDYSRKNQPLALETAKKIAKLLEKD